MCFMLKDLPLDHTEFYHAKYLILKTGFKSTESKKLNNENRNTINIILYEYEYYMLYHMVNPIL